MKKAEVEEIILAMWREWPYRIGETLADDGFLFYGYVQRRFPELLDFRAKGERLDIVLKWLREDESAPYLYPEHLHGGGEYDEEHGYLGGVAAPKRAAPAPIDADEPGKKQSKAKGKSKRKRAAKAKYAPEADAGSLLKMNGRKTKKKA